MRKYVMPIQNSGKTAIAVEMEPEGDWYPLEPGEKCEVRISVADSQELDLELEIRDHLVLVYCSADKEVWKGAQKLR